MSSQAALTRDYQDYVPHTDVMHEEDSETLLISLPGFRKDQLKVQLTTIPTLKISGERPIGGNKWIRFQKEYPVSSISDKTKITARFDTGILYIRQPKLNTPAAAKRDEEKLKKEAQNPQKNEKETQPQLPQRDEEDKFHETDDTDVAQRFQEDKETAKEGVKNDEKGVQKRVEEYEKCEVMTGRVKMAQKMGRMMSIVVVVLSAVALGIYVKSLITPSAKKIDMPPMKRTQVLHLFCSEPLPSSSFTWSNTLPFLHQKRSTDKN